MSFSAPHQVYTVGPSGTSLLMWAATGNHGNQWTYANVILSNTAPFRVTFQAEAGGDVWTDIALDDISYTAECVEGKVSSLVSFLSLRFICTLSFPVLSALTLIFHATFFHRSPSPISSFSTYFCPPNIRAPLLRFHINCVDPQGECSELMEPVAL